MKTINDRKSHLLATAGALHESGRYDDLKERLETDVVLSAAWVAIIALYVVMAVALYRWDRYAPVFPPDGGAGVPIAQSMIWSQ
jgi:hypothetical protein